LLRRRYREPKGLVRHGTGWEEEKRSIIKKGGEGMRGGDSTAEADVKINAQIVEDRRQAFFPEKNTI